MLFELIFIGKLIMFVNKEFLSILNLKLQFVGGLYYKLFGILLKKNEFLLVELGNKGSF